MAECGLHKLIERGYGLDASPDVDPELWQEILDFCRAAASRVVCFDMGDAQNIDALTPVPGMLNLPYPTCWFECAQAGAGGDRIGVMASERLDGQLGFSFLSFTYQRGADAGWYFLALGRVSVSPEGVIEVDYPEVSPSRNRFAVIAAGTVARFLSALNCCNVQRVEHQPPEKLNRARRKRGKQPMFSCWTLHVDLDREGGSHASGDGSHASPRLHLRRGHARQVRPGVFAWVRAHLVGDKSKGVVSKDYAA